ncbi:MAG TPA: serine--tRNA ligase [Gammaproteobacteria bacterium]|nr:serine--tRNA ligase [Gammaproteobacteria bacterium]
MLDPQLLRSHIEDVRVALARRGLILDVVSIKALEDERKDLQVRTQELQAARNSKSKAIGAARKRGEDTAAMMAEVTGLGEQLAASENKLADVQARIHEFALHLPNMPHAGVPDGKGPEDNVEQRRWGAPPKFDFAPKDHVELGAALEGMDFDVAAKIASSRFVVLSGPLARMQRALIQFMLDLHIREHGYTEVYVPFLVNADSMRGTGQLPKFKTDLFHVPQQDFYLIPTAEVPVTNIARDAILDVKTLPRKYACHSPCFRSEAGSYGKDTRGMIRQHQFEKVELVQLVEPTKSYDALEALTGHAEEVLKRLALPYRVVALCAGDMGFAAAKTYDLEVWLPGQNAYREISSCSNFENFQSRRMMARFRSPETGKTELLHTLNGSGVAAGRALIAVMENYQSADGSIRVPEVLRPYMGGVSLITRQS